MISANQIYTNAPNIITFDLPDARQPDNQDCRLLGIALRELTINPVTL
jgi:hypothetical protein